MWGRRRAQDPTRQACWAGAGAGWGPGRRGRLAGAWRPWREPAFRAGNGVPPVRDGHVAPLATVAPVECRGHEVARPTPPWAGVREAIDRAGGVSPDAGERGQGLPYGFTDQHRSWRGATGRHKAGATGDPGSALASGRPDEATVERRAGTRPALRVFRGQEVGTPGWMPRAGWDKAGARGAGRPGWHRGWQG